MRQAVTLVVISELKESMWSRPSTPLNKFLCSEERIML